MSELKANELRIGNFVLDKDKKVRTVYSVLENALIIGQNQFIGTPIEWCNPIPLTEELLIKFGFFNNELKAEHNLFVWYENHIGIKGMLGIVKPCKCIYAHQLQNLYFALTGKELPTDNL